MHMFGIGAFLWRKRRRVATTKKYAFIFLEKKSARVS